MPDLDKLLDDPGISGHAREAVRPSDIDALIRRGATRRRRTQVRVVGSAVLAAAVIVVLGVVGLDRGTDDRPEPAPSPTPPRSLKLKELKPEQIVQYPDARLEALEVSDDDPDVRAAIWRLCGNKSCAKHRMAVAVSADGFDTTRYVAIKGGGWNADLDAIDEGSFYLKSNSGPMVIRPDGTEIEVEQTRPAGPLGDNEVLIPGTALAVSTEGRHRISSPALELAKWATGGITGVGTDGAYWSADGGATWDSRDLPRYTDITTYHPIRSEDPDTIAFLESGDGATLAPVIGFQVSHDGGTTWEHVAAPEPGGERAYFSWAVVRPDGSLIIQFEGWSDDRRRKPSKRPRGPYLSAGNDWSRLTPVSPGLPERHTSPVPARPPSVTNDGDDVSLYISQGARAYSSTDGGETWQETPAR